MQVYNQQRKSEIEEMAAKTPASSLDEKEEAKLKLILDQDGDMAKLYQEMYSDIKEEKEKDFNEILRIHERYDD